MKENTKKRAAARREEPSSQKAAPKGGKIDLVFLTYVLILMIFGLVVLFSASYAYAYYYDGNSFHYIIRQAAFAVAGVGVMLFVGNVITPAFIRKWWLFLYLAVLVMLGMVFLFDPVNEAHRWIFIGPVSFQPSEIAKFTVILCFAHFLDKYYGKKIGFLRKMSPYIVILVSICGLVVIEPHISATLLLVCIAGIMLLIGDNDKRIWISLLVVMVIGVTAFVAIPALRERAMSRIGPWLSSQATLDVDLMAYQTKQSLYAIASGGLFGVGLGNSRQKHLYLPEPQNDFIFAILCEELGIIGAVVVIILFVLLISRGIRIAMRAKDRFSSFLALGVCAQVAVQTLLNIAVVTNFIPNTGIALPFFSYGGTQLMILLAEMGVVLAVSKSARLEK